MKQVPRRFLCVGVGIGVLALTAFYCMPFVQQALLGSGDTVNEKASTAIRTALPSTNITRIAASVIPGLYEVNAGENTLYVDENGRYLIVGHIYDLNTATDLTQPEAGAEHLDVATVAEGVL